MDPGQKPARTSDERLATIVGRLRDWASELGFTRLGISDVDLAGDEARLEAWLAAGMHGTMDYMARHGRRRSRPDALIPETCRVICVRMDYLPQARPWQAVLDQADLAYVARYALGRDYHKLVRKRLQRLAHRLQAEIADTACRVFCDSAPVLEKPLARKAGLGWIGKHTNLIAREAGSWFFLGEIYTDLPLPVDEPASDHCGACRRCIDCCPTGAITAPYRLDARRCIAYLTIEHRGPIPRELRPLIGNRIFGCDDCQLVCPWNRFARYTSERDFAPRHGLDAADLCALFAWDETKFLEYTSGSPIRRIGHEGWLRNLAIALGNALAGHAPARDKGLVDGAGIDGTQRRRIQQALETRRDHPSPLVREHCTWALDQVVDDHGTDPGEGRPTCGPADPVRAGKQHGRGSA